jgi:hypothetical protein
MRSITPPSSIVRSGRQIAPFGASCADTVSLPVAFAL